MPASEQGASRDRYMLIPRVLIFVTRGTRVLLLKGAPGKRLWAGKYNGVGGHLEPGEDVLTAARRELREETGLQVDLRLVGTVVVNTGENPGIGIYVFTGECARGEPRPSAEGAAEWIELADLPGLPAVADLPALLDRLRRLRPDDPPFAARSYYEAEGRLYIEFIGE
jgi:8-oxo-dGTP diphosphatase